ncbi:NADH-quinone oxidoreductase subunit NuoE [bacterium]|nr:NADH-quinone oxidoreductase subunit NuoE [candidate division CSSED10-310 bacterium]
MTQAVEIDRSQVLQNVLEKNEFKASALIAILQDIQHALGFLPEDVLEELADMLKIPRSQVYSVVTFYKAFKLVPPGKHNIKVCLGTACHIKGGSELIRTLESQLGIKEGQVTEDGLFSFEPVMCVGCCGLAPVMMIDETFHGKMTPKQIPKILNECKKKEE